MANKTVAADAALETKTNETQVAPERKTVTNWRVFDVGKFVPARLKCDTYQREHPLEQACHTSIPATTENILRHMAPEHGNGYFKFKLRTSDSKASPIWHELEEAGVEIQELWCPHCRTNVTLTPRNINYHLQPHPGALRVNLEPQTLCMTLGYANPDIGEYDNLYEVEG